MNTQSNGIPHNPVSGSENINAFGVPLIRCPKCGIIWVKQFAPEFCFECKTRVTHKPGKGFGRLLEFMERINSPIPTFNCPKCNLVIPENIRHQIKVCFRCYAPLNGQVHIDTPKDCQTLTANNKGTNIIKFWQKLKRTIRFT